MTDIWLVYSTFPNRDEAVFAARQLLEKRLIACANIHDIALSLYRWEGEIQEEAEVALTCKTRRDKVDAAVAEIKRLHSYETPCVVAYEVTDGFGPFLDWIRSETA